MLSVLSTWEEASGLWRRFSGKDVTRAEYESMGRVGQVRRVWRAPGGRNSRARLRCGTIWMAEEADAVGLLGRLGGRECRGRGGKVGRSQAREAVYAPEALTSLLRTWVRSHCPSA